MKSVKSLIWFVGLMVVAAGCNKTAVTLTAEEQLARDIELIDQYVAEKGLTVVRLENGLRYVMTFTGDGPTPTKDNCFTMKYVGRVLNAEEEFDSSGEAGYKAPLKSQISGIQIMLKLMPVGSKATVFMPSALGYATTPRTGIPANSVLHFDLELLSITSYNAAGNYCY